MCLPICSAKTPLLAVQVEKTDAQLRKAVAAHRGAEREVEGKRKLQAAAQKQALQLDKKAGRQQKDVDSQVRVDW